MAKPLMSICFTCYNRKKFVREALQSALDQTYEPLEIVISDNGSTDGTAEIVTEMVEKYRANGGVHKIVLNCNERNIGGSDNIQKCYSLASGELLISAHDDDISLPNRVETIANAWIEHGCKPLAIIHASYLIDTSDKVIGYLDDKGLDHPLQAATAYSPKLFQMYHIDWGDCPEDIFFTRIAAMLGEVVVLKDRIMKYRVGCGVSASATTDNRPTLKMLYAAELRSAKRLYSDLDNLKSRMSDDDYIMWRKRIDGWKRVAEGGLNLVSSNSFVARWNGFLAVHEGGYLNMRTIGQLLYVLPQWIGDPLLRFSNLINRIRRRLWHSRSF